ncbi:hypothetical protein IscW_ISCW001693 [Ixodes scapularis]|uniref:Uncharacterized protein n=1 Tax=Ixodes scapularis TaxID=6945 RepID=B7P495_IXOSC|nr:hypothetical protein IscW_ISCW001693 [Ixodes scapularis]|eukprot:XP_002405651.1 hypothetical protein IscW_ISCW001693 [Ixodes scapularis]
MSCRICGGPRLHGDGHDRFLFHRSWANNKSDSFIRPQHVDDSAEHPDAIRSQTTKDGCFGPGDCATETANATHQAWPSGLYDLINVDINLDLL